MPDSLLYIVACDVRYGGRLCRQGELGHAFRIAIRALRTRPSLAHRLFFELMADVFRFRVALRAAGLRGCAWCVFVERIRATGGVQVGRKFDGMF